MASEDITRRSPTAAEVLTPLWRQQVADLRSRENDVRDRRPEAVHDFRVASRRLRSSLAGLEPLLDGRTCLALADDLRRTAVTIGPAQDAQVVGRHVDALFSGEWSPAARDLHARLGVLLAGTESASWERALEHLDSPAYDELTRGLERFADLPPWLPDAHLPADDVLRPLLRSEWSRFRRRARAALQDTDGEGADERLHQARKASKRARYLAESLSDLLGRRAKRLATVAEQVQELLGEHQDRVLTLAFLGDAQQRLSLAGDDVAVLARVRDAAAAAAAADRTGSHRLLREADRKSLRSWMR